VHVVATLRFKPDNAASGAFSVCITTPSYDINAEFNGSGEVELNEVTFETLVDEQVLVRVVDNQKEVLFHNTIPVEAIQSQSDWSIAQTEDFEVLNTKKSYSIYLLIIYRFVFNFRLPLDCQRTHLRTLLSYLLDPRHGTLKQRICTHC
jgi:hypothetical protein